MEGLLDNIVIVSILQKYLDLSDIMNITLVNHRLYSKEWRFKMQKALALEWRIKKRWPFLGVVDIILSIRSFKRKALAMVVFPGEDFYCWIGKCRKKIHPAKELANREYFSHTTCQGCAFRIWKSSMPYLVSIDNTAVIYNHEKELRKKYGFKNNTYKRVTYEHLIKERYGLSVIMSFDTRPVNFNHYYVDLRKMEKIYIEKYKP